MSFKTLFRVWDVFLVDGLDALFRISLAILRSNEAELLRCESIPAVYVSLENLPTRMWEVDNLLQVRYYYLNNLNILTPIVPSSWRPIFATFSFIHRLSPSGKHTSPS